MRLPHRLLYTASHIKNPLPATFIRGGTSKGIFLLRRDLPSDTSKWAPIFARIMGSPDPLHKRQLNGMGGGISSLSKIVVVSQPQSSKIPRETVVDIEYTFVQVGIEDDKLDVSGNCGNLTTAVGVFAIDEGLCKPAMDQDGMGTVKLWNTNTNKVIKTTFPVSRETKLAELEREEIEIAGVPGKASRILLEFDNPAGARTGKLIPTGETRNMVDIGDGQMVEISCVDATNPTVFVHVNSILESPQKGWVTKAAFPLEKLEKIRRAGAVAMGLDPEMQAQPKICMVGPAENEEQDFVARALSMGQPHKAIPGTVALCIAGAAGVRGCIVNELVKDKINSSDVAVRVGIPGGVVGIRSRWNGGGLKNVAIERTARRLMRGEVFW
jgi:2-methylaconitate cis-trans-isomerase PrpF